MYKPKKGSLREQVCAWLVSAGPSTMADITTHFRAHGYSTVSAAIFQLKHRGALVEDHALYDLADHIKRHYGMDVPEKEPEAALPVRAFKPWSGQASLPREARRPDADPLREIYFKTGSVGFAPGWKL